MTSIVLASTSIYRKALLDRLGLPFSIASPHTDETALPNESPRDLVERLSIAKAEAVAKDLSEGLVIGSDQVAVHGDTIVGKPHTHENAVNQLRTASGTTVQLLTGLALINAANGNVQSDVVPFAVTFRTLSDEIIENYLRAEQPYACAGSLKAEGLGISLLEKFSGDDPNALIGLPLIRLCSMLRQEGLDPAIEALVHTDGR